MFRLAVPLPKTFTHFLFMHKDVWNQSVSSFSRLVSPLTAYSSAAAWINDGINGGIETPNQVAGTSQVFFDELFEVHRSLLSARPCQLPLLFSAFTI